VPTNTEIGLVDFLQVGYEQGILPCDNIVVLMAIIDSQVLGSAA